MAKLWKVCKIVAAVAAGLYALLFAVFFFDLDGKLLYYVVEPFLVKHYDKMPRRDMTKEAYKVSDL